MTPTAIIALVRDVAILAALGFVLWFVTHAEHNSDELKSIKATLTETQQWQKEQNNASEKAKTSMQALDAHLSAIDGRGPVIVRVPVPSSPSAAPASSHSGADASGSGQGSCGAVRQIDIGPVLAEFERKYATALIKCQQTVDSWPK